MSGGIVFEAPGVVLHHGDCIEVMRELPDASVHAVVTDPPYGISFMGKQWDQPGEFGSTRKNGTPSPHRRGANRETKLISNGSMAAGLYDLSPSAMRNFQRWCEAWATECLRVLKPGGHLLSFGGSRTWHRLAAGIEDAGFEIRDSIAWLYGSGFPKSMDVSKAIDKALGAERHDVYADRTAVTDNEAREWEGWGTALKPAFEPIVVARKPLVGTVAGNVLAHGTGALNIDANRVEWGPEGDASAARKAAGYSEAAKKALGRTVASESTTGFAGDVIGTDSSGGRWPTNVVLEESQADELDKQTGTLTSGANPAVRGGDTDKRAVYGGFTGGRNEQPRRGTDSGGGSRFFPTFRYEAKAPTAERPKAGEVQHPTVKPLDLMRWLVRLVTPPNGIILEPFAGSGTTLEAALIEGFEVIGIEREADYLPLIEARITKPLQPTMFGDWDGDAA